MVPSDCRVRQAGVSGWRLGRAGCDGEARESNRRNVSRARQHYAGPGQVQGSELEGNAADQAQFAVVQVNLAKQLEVVAECEACGASQANVVQVAGDDAGAAANFQFVIELVAQTSTQAEGCVIETVGHTERAVEGIYTLGAAVNFLVLNGQASPDIGLGIQAMTIAAANVQGGQVNIVGEILEAAEGEDVFVNGEGTAAFEPQKRLRFIAGVKRQATLDIVVAQALGGNGCRQQGGSGDKSGNSFFISHLFSLVFGRLLGCCP